MDLESEWLLGCRKACKHGKACRQNTFHCVALTQAPGCPLACRQEPKRVLNLPHLSAFGTPGGEFSAENMVFRSPKMHGFPVNQGSHLGLADCSFKSQVFRPCKTVLSDITIQAAHNMIASISARSELFCTLTLHNLA